MSFGYEEHPLHEHYHYLTDEARLAAFERAIGQVVRPGNVVLDLGSGTGILGFFACRAGAERVYAIEVGDVIELARNLSRVNGLDERFQFIKGISTRVELPQPVDVIITDQIGQFGFHAGLLEYVSDARERFLKRGGDIIPRRVDLLVAPLEHAAMYAHVDFWEHSHHGFDFRPARTIAANLTYATPLPAEHLLDQPASVYTIELAQATLQPFEARASFVIQRAGVLHGLGGWFAAELAAGVKMTNVPTADRPIRRMGLFFPIERPVDVAAGDKVRVWMLVVPGEHMISWECEVQGRQSVRFSHSTFQSVLLSREIRAKSAPDFVPQLNRAGQARRAVLQACDGRKTLAEIRVAIHEQFRDLFATPAEAARFVAEIVSRHTR